MITVKKVQLLPKKAKTQNNSVYKQAPYLQGTVMIVCIGLGNPGAQYLINRHNVGFMMIDMLAQDYHFPDFKQKGQALLSEGSVDSKKCLMVKPLTFMNNSGAAVTQIIQFYKIPLENVIVFHDDLDLPFGKMRVKRGGGAGGHNGLRSLDAHIGKDYWRVRIGINHPGDKDLVLSHVLGNFDRQEQKELPFILGAIADHFPLMLDGQIAEFQTAVA